MAQELTDADIAMDGANLYQEETFTDRRIGTLVRLPISFEIDATSLEEAVAKFGRDAQEAVQSTIKRLEELRREAASSLIIPGSGAGPMGPSGPLGGPGGVRGGGIQLP